MHVWFLLKHELFYCCLEFCCVTSPCRRFVGKFVSLFGHVELIAGQLQHVGHGPQCLMIILRCPLRLRLHVFQTALYDCPLVAVTQLLGHALRSSLHNKPGVHVLEWANHSEAIGSNQA